jgi:hypothetical protein
LLHRSWDRRNQNPEFFAPYLHFLLIDFLKKPYYTEVQDTRLFDFPILLQGWQLLSLALLINTNFKRSIHIYCKSQGAMESNKQTRAHGPPVHNIEFAVRPSQLTFHSNRGRAIREFLEGRGWRKAESTEKAIFSMWDTYKRSPRYGHWELFPRALMRRIDSKRGQAKMFHRAGCAHIAPLVFLSVEDFERAGGFRIAPIWYVKAAHMTGGKGVICVSDQRQLRQAIEKLSTPSYVIQRGISDLHLIDDKKYVIRAYLLLLANLAAFLYEEFLIIIHGRPYDATSTKHDVQVGHARAEWRSSFEFDWFPSLHLKIHRASKSAMQAIVRSLKGLWSAGAFQLFGIDFLCSADRNIWLIEINAWPTFGYRRVGRDKICWQRKVKFHLLDDLLTMLFPWERPSTGRFKPLDIRSHGYM